MNKTKIKYFGIFLLLLISITFCGCYAKLLDEKIESFNYDAYKDIPKYSTAEIYGEDINFGELKTAENAAKVVEKIWFDVFDKAEILKQRPYVVSYDDKNDIWKVEGNPDYCKDSPGGTACALITKDGNLITCWHGE